MTNASTPRPQRARPVGQRGRRFGFGQSTFWTVVGSLLPGSGLIAGRRHRRLGIALLALFAIGIASLLIWAAVDRRSLLQLAVRPAPLIIAAIGLPLVALVWVAVIVRTHLDTRPAVLTTLQRVISSVLVGGLAFAVAAPLAVAGRYSYDQFGLVSQVFRTTDDSQSGTRPDLGGDNPFQDKPRVNVLLIGADDAYGGDKGNIRTDTMMLASIDTRTGDTVLVSIPRQTMHIPFPADSPLARYYPDGYTSSYDEAEGMANAIYYNVPQEVPADILGKTDDLGADVLKLGIGEATGLPVDYYVMVNFRGYRKLIDSLGGITVNINRHVPIGGNTDRGIPPEDQLNPGPNQHLDGFQALWFARGRYGQDDYQRNIRQRCSVNAIIQQANPINVLQRYEAIASASASMVETDIPQEMLPAMVDLSLRVKDAKVRSLAAFDGDDSLSTADPDFDALRQRVQESIKETEQAAPKKQEPAPPGGEPAPPGGGGTTEPQPEESEEPSTAPSTDGGDGGGQPSAAPKERSQDLASSCEFDPKAAAESQPYYTTGR
ncbi:LCP family protein [Naumannella cuiyingiana]|nr:LCP family protein [Naumannella cuiyingiana]